MNAMPPSNTVAASTSYEERRFNALQHGVLSRHAVLPWEDRSEYQALLAALVAEHAPNGPTEGHLVEELAGIFWRKRRLQLAEAAIYRDQLRKDAINTFEPDHIAAAALLPAAGKLRVKVDLPKVFAATEAETARDLRHVKRDQAMTQKSESILAAGGPGAYTGALAALRDDTRSYWLECLEEASEGNRSYQATAEALEAWLRRNRKEWFEDPIVELEHRDAIREQAFGTAYAAQRLQVTARYEVHLDRRLERILSMLIRLREFHGPTMPA